MKNNEITSYLRKEILVRLVRLFRNSDSKTFTMQAGKIPYEMRPKNSKIDLRCCIHKERFILRCRVIAALGQSVETDDEMTSLGEYAQKALERERPEEHIMTVIDGACQGCTPNRVFVTDLCQGCVARPCVSSCAFGAVTVTDLKSKIDSAKCKSCGLCIKACPYSAIIKVRVPCEEACAVNAIQKNAEGFAQIDFDKCISCGHCVLACPFAAVSEKGQVIDVLKAMKAGKRVVAMLAPSVVGQLPNSIGQIASALKKAGFSKVYEVAQGADMTTRHEVQDFKERMDRGDSFMTTSCCAAYQELVEKHIPELKPYVSESGSPMHYIAEFAKEQDPECVTVFIGPCVAKRREGYLNPHIDYVMSFEEMGALFVGLEIEVSACEEYEFEVKSSAQGRNFAVTGGVAESVKTLCKGCDFNSVIINGFSRDNIKELKNFAKKGECGGNIVEVMACEGGCVGGSNVLNNKRIATKEIKKYAADGEEIKD